MSTRQEQPSTPPQGSDTKNNDSTTQPGPLQDVWAELFGIVHGLSESMGLALQAFTPTDDKAVSAITKKRLAIRSIQSLKQGQSSAQTLLEHLQALQAASQTWQRSMMFASKSHQELMEQIETTTEELHATNERLRVVEAQRLAAVRDAESLRTRWAQQEAHVTDLQNTLKQRDDDLETLSFRLNELQSSAVKTQQTLERLTQDTAEANERATTAEAALDAAKAEATKAQGLAERHQQVVAKLTADNLVFLMQLKKAEADLAAANQERNQLRLAAEQQRGPWFDQVRAGVEERVRLAMQRSQELEAQMEDHAAQHAAQLEAVRLEKSQLEAELDALRQTADELNRGLESATEAKQRAEDSSSAATAAEQRLRQQLEELSAENRVLQESVRSMRQECTERWVTEQSALSQVGSLEERAQEQEQLLADQAAQVALLQQQLETQAGINRQLMAKKEEVEWQLMAAMAKLDNGSADGPVPLNLRVSGLLQVGQSGRGDAAGQVADISATAPAAKASQSSGGGQSSEGAHGEQPVAARDYHLGAPGAASRLGSALAAQPAFIEGLTGASSSQPARRQWGMSETGSGAPGRSGAAGAALAAHSQSPAGHGGVAAATYASLAPAEREPQLVREQHALVERGLIERQADGANRSAQPGTLASTPGASRVGGSTGLGGISDVPVRWTSIEGASTAVSSPPSSVALSTEPGSPHETSRVPSAVSYRGLVQGAVPTVTIRTAPMGPRMGPAGGAAGASGLGSAAAGLGLGPARRDDGMDAVGRRGSLHDGGDVWLADAASSASSDDSDLFAAGIMVVRGVHEESGRAEMPLAPHQVILHELQQQLQEHLQAQPARGGMPQAAAAPRNQQQQRDSTGGAALQRDCDYSELTAGPKPGALSASTGPASDREDKAAFLTSRAAADDDDVMHVRAGQARGTTRPAIVMRTAPAQPSTAPKDNTSNAPSRYTVGSMFDRNEGAIGGVFSIMKGTGASQASRTGVLGSPVHPALSATSPRASQNSPSASAAALRALTAAVPDRQGQHVPQADTGAAASPKPHPDPAVGPPGGPVPSRVQAGPPFYATAGALSGTVVAAYERWSSGGGSAKEGAPPASSSQQQEAGKQQTRQSYESMALSSPARAGALQSPRSPPHPAIFVALSSCSTSGRQCVQSGGDRAALTDAPKRANGVGAIASASHPSERTKAVDGVTGMATAASEGGPAAGAQGLSPAATVRPRVSFQGIFPRPEMASPGTNGRGPFGAVGSLSSSAASSFHGASTQAPGATHKSSSVKSVRFSDHDPEDGPPRHSRASSVISGGLRSSTQFTLDTRGRPSHERPDSSPSADSGRPSPGSSTRPQPAPYLSRGPVQHPAMIAMATAVSSASQTTSAQEVPESTPSKRFSAVGVAVTAVPRGPAARQ